MTETKCPSCGCERHYALGDHRLQCAACRTKFTARAHAGRLSPATLQLIAREFWRMAPASAAAAELGMNSKTLQKYYDLMRRAVTEAGEDFAVQHFGTAAAFPALFHTRAAPRGVAAGAHPLFCLAQAGGKLALLRVGEERDATCGDSAITTLLGWVYAQDRRALVEIDLDRTHFLAADAARCTTAATAFWPAVKRGLVRYHGGFRKNFYLFVREMEFRFNTTDDAAAVDLLTAILHRQ